MSQVGGIAGPRNDFLVFADPEFKAFTPSGAQETAAIRKNVEQILGGILNERPDLLPPIMASGLSLETLLEAVGAEERRTGVQAASESLKAKADSRKQLNETALQELQKRIDKLAQEKTLSPFMKAFKFIGMALGAIASIATVALGVMTGNPLMVAAGVLMAVMVVDQIVSEASDGKYSIAAGVAYIAKECGASEETAKWIGFAATMLLTVASIACSFGSAAAAKTVDVATKVMTVLTKVQQATALVNGVAAVGSGACQIAKTVLDYQIAESKARSKEILAILERLRESVEAEEDFLKALVENFEGLMQKVSQIVKDSAQAQMELAASGSPPMA
jgi:hypothetical protein